MDKSTRKKILLLSLAYDPFIGGAEVAVKEITDRLEEYEFDMITVNLDGRQEESEKMGNVHVHRIGAGKRSKYFFPWQAQYRAETMHKDRHYDAVWAIMANQAGLAASFFKKKNPSVPFLLTLQEGDSEFDIWIRTFYMRLAYAAIYRRADSIQAISKYLARRAKKMGAKSDICVVPNGVNEAFLDIRGGNRGARVVITTSRLEKKNNIGTLIRAMSYVEGKLVIAGNGSERKRLENLSKDLGLEKRVEFLGSVSHEIIRKHFEDASVFVRPSVSEGLGSSFLEAMAAGIPIVGTRVGGIPDFLIEGETGLFCEAESPKSVSEKIRILFSDEELYRRLSRNGKMLVEKKYVWSGICGDMRKIFNMLWKEKIK